MAAVRANASRAPFAVAKNAGKLPCAPLTVPREIDEAVARRKLASLGVEIDTMTTEQKDYMGI